ncbi:MAG: hypothetical protein ACJ790_03675, partial [Myxococcaceae bacterium]
ATRHLLELGHRRIGLLVIATDWTSDVRRLRGYLAAHEESGVPVDLEGILRVEHSPSASGTSRCRVLFVARPRDDVSPKTIPDEHSLGAGWFTLEEMKQMKLRGNEVLTACEHVLRGGAIYPLRLLTSEAAGWD